MATSLDVHTSTLLRLSYSRRDPRSLKRRGPGESVCLATSVTSSRCVPAACSGNAYCDRLRCFPVAACLSGQVAAFLGEGAPVGYMAFDLGSTASIRCCGAISIVQLRTTALPATIALPAGEATNDSIPSPVRPGLEKSAAPSVDRVEGGGCKASFYRTRRTMLDA